MGKSFVTCDLGVAVIQSVSVATLTREICIEVCGRGSDPFKS